MNCKSIAIILLCFLYATISAQSLALKKLKISGGDKGSFPMVMEELKIKKPAKITGFHNTLLLLTPVQYFGI